MNVKEGPLLLQPLVGEINSPVKKGGGKDKKSD